MSPTTATEMIQREVPDERVAMAAVAGFLAGYCDSTRRSYATDLCLFADWCSEGRLGLLHVRRAHLELFGRWMEETGRMRSTVARRLSTLASFYLLPPGGPGRHQPGSQGPSPQAGL
jgi:integrase/recombinase XerD